MRLTPKWPDVIQVDAHGRARVVDPSGLKGLLIRGNALPATLAGSLAASEQFDVLGDAIEHGCLTEEAARSVLAAAPGLVRPQNMRRWTFCVYRCVRACVDDAGGAMVYLGRHGVSAPVMHHALGDLEFVAALRARDEAELAGIYQALARSSPFEALEHFDRAVLSHFPGADAQAVRVAAAATLAAEVDDYGLAAAAWRRSDNLRRLVQRAGLSPRVREALQERVRQGALRSPGSADLLRGVGAITEDDRETCARITALCDGVTHRLAALGYSVNGIVDGVLSLFREDGDDAHDQAIARLIEDGLCTQARVVNDEPGAPSLLLIPVAALRRPQRQEHSTTMDLGGPKPPAPLRNGAARAA